MTNFEERAFLERAQREHSPSKEIIFLPSGRKLTRPLTAEYARKKYSTPIMSDVVQNPRSASSARVPSTA
jgi:hypothetical protein